MLDGRHTGTGGGNHIVVGGSTPDDSPSSACRICSAARRVLDNHRRCHYLFSGLFVGPTSQAQRIDEARTTRWPSSKSLRADPE